MPEKWGGETITSRLSRLQRTYAALGGCAECGALSGNPCRERSLTGRKVVRLRPHLVRTQDVSGEAVQG